MIETGDLAGKRVDRPCDTPDGTREVVVRDRPDCPLSPYFANLFITMNDDKRYNRRDKPHSTPLWVSDKCVDATDAIPMGILVCSKSCQCQWPTFGVPVGIGRLAVAQIKKERTDRNRHGHVDEGTR